MSNGDEPTPPPQPTPEDLARQNFGQRAEFYTTSAAHTDPQVLARVVELARCSPKTRALDVATGTGHTAFALAPHAARVLAVDLTPEMLDQARALAAAKGMTNVDFEIADAHALPYQDGSFDVVTCRRAAHHFSQIGKALDEMRRVLKSEGRLVIDDRSVPENAFTDRAMNLLDTLHDASHVREYRPSEWVRLLQNHGFDVEAVEPYSRHRPLTSLTQDVAPEDVKKIHDYIAGLNDDERAKLKIETINGELYINHWFVILAGTKVR
jgi:ubiquinone/menaquinone biosynthesis C-methylase UbiE